MRGLLRTLELRATVALASLLFSQSAASEAPGTWLGQTLPDFAARWTRVPSAVMASPQGAALRTSELQIGIGIGIGVANVTVGTVDAEVGLDYQYTRHEYGNIAGRDRDLHRLQAPIHFRRTGTAWTLSGYLAPGLATSSNVIKDALHRVTADDLYLSGRLVARRSMGAQTAWLAGLAYDRSFGNAQLYPVAGIETRIGSGLVLRAAFPDPALRLDIGDGQSLLLRVYPAGFRWHVVTDDFADEFDYTLRAVRADLNWSVALGRRFLLDLALGYEFARHHDFLAGHTVVDADIADQWLASIGLRWHGAPLQSTHGSHL